MPYVPAGNATNRQATSYVPLAPREWIDDPEGIGFILYYAPYRRYHWFCKKCYLTDEKSWDAYKSVDSDEGNGLFWSYKDQFKNMRQICGVGSCTFILEGMGLNTFPSDTGALPSPTEILAQITGRNNVR